MEVEEGEVKDGEGRRGREEPCVRREVRKAEGWKEREEAGMARELRCGVKRDERQRRVMGSGKVGSRVA